MKKYYIFSINKEFYEVYKNNPQVLFKTLDNLYKEYEICNDCGEMRKTSEFYQYSHQVLTLLDNNIAYDDDNDQIELSFNKNYNDTTQTIKVSK